MNIHKLVVVQAEWHFHARRSTMIGYSPLTPVPETSLL